MKPLIESSSALIEALKEDYIQIRKFDPLRERRNKTNAFRLKLFRKFGQACGYCNKTLEALSLEAAHIVPLEIGGQTTEENLIILCIPCHRSYDSGHCSINYMTQVSKDWRNGRLKSDRPELGKMTPQVLPMRPPPINLIQNILGEVGLFQVARKYAKGSRLIEQHLSTLPANDPGRINLSIKLAELMRRRSARGALYKAQRILETIDTTGVSSELKAQYCSELGYLYRQLGRHANASNMMRKSAAAARHASHLQLGIDFVAAAAGEVLYKMAIDHRLTNKKAAHFEKRLRRLSNTARRMGAYWGARWTLNCECNILLIHIKAKNSSKAWKKLEQVRTRYFDWDLQNGWDIATRQGITLVEGLVRVLLPRTNDDIDTGVELLARAFLTRLGRRQRPDSIRDAGFALAHGLRKKGIRRLVCVADRLDEVMHRTVDGASVLWPWRAT